MASEESIVHFMTAQQTLSSPVNHWVRTPGFGAEKLSPAQLDKFCALLDKEKDSSKSSPYIAAIVCYALHCTGVQYEDFIGSIRKILFDTTHETCEYLPENMKIFQLGPRKDLLRKIRTHYIFKPLKAKHAFLNAYDWDSLVHAGSWFERMLVNHVTTEMTFLNNNVLSIEAKLKCRADQNDSIKWAGSKIGKTMLSSDEETLQDRSAELAKLPTQSKRALESCYIVVTSSVPRNATDDLATRTTPGPDLESKLVQLSALRRAAAAADREAETQETETGRQGELDAAAVQMSQDFPLAFLLSECVRAFGIQQSSSRSITLAWANPFSFFGYRDKLCEIRTPFEFELVLGELHKIHLLQAEDDRLHVRLVEKKFCVPADSQRKASDTSTGMRTQMSATKAEKNASKRQCPSTPEGYGRGQRKRQKIFENTPSP